MLTLMLLRHAKAEAQPRHDDYARTLTGRGIDEASALGRHLAEIDLLPDVALVSAAARTRETFELLAAAAGRQIAARFEPGLYDASDVQLRDTLRHVDAGTRVLMLVGHNEGIMDAAISLAGDGDAVELARLRSRFPPCALAVIAFDTGDWSEARCGGGRLDLLLMPEDLRPPD